MINRFLFKL